MKDSKQCKKTKVITLDPTPYMSFDYIMCLLKAIRDGGGNPYKTPHVDRVWQRIRWNLTQYLSQYGLTDLLSASSKKLHNLVDFMKQLGLVQERNQKHFKLGLTDKGCFLDRPWWLIPYMRERDVDVARKHILWSALCTADESITVPLVEKADQHIGEKPLFTDVILRAYGVVKRRKCCDAHQGYIANLMNDIKSKDSLTDVEGLRWRINLLVDLRVFDRQIFHHSLFERGSFFTDAIELYQKREQFQSEGDLAKHISYNLPN